MRGPRPWRKGPTRGQLRRAATNEFASTSSLPREALNPSEDAERDDPDVVGFVAFASDPDVEDRAEYEREVFGGRAVEHRFESERELVVVEWTDVVAPERDAPARPKAERARKVDRVPDPR